MFDKAILKNLLNHKLFFEKEKLLLDLKVQSYVQSIKKSTEFSFHGIELKIFSNSDNFHHQLKNLFPVSWYFKQNKPIEIYFIEPRDFTYDLHSWENESSPDCFELHERSIIIQRDFAAKRISENQYFVVCENIITDGFNNFFRWMLPAELLKHNIYLIHSGAVIDTNTEATLFLGHSGAGKSTACHLSKKSSPDSFEILNDDMNLLYFKNLKLKTKPAGLGGLFPTQKLHLDADHDVKNIFWLFQSEQNRVENISPSRAMSKTLASISNLPWKLLSLESKDKIFDFAQTVSQHVPVKNLYLKKDSSFWKTISQSNKEARE